eukprot:scaffold1.g5745.t1
MLSDAADPAALARHLARKLLAGGALPELPTKANFQLHVVEAGEELTPGQTSAYVAICVLLVVFSGIMAGLTLGLLSLDKIDIEVVKRSGTDKERWLLNPAAAVVISVTAILVFGEIIPQAVCKKFGLVVGAYLAWLVRLLMVATAPVTWPIGKLLDWVLGEESALYRRQELKAVVEVHAETQEDGSEPGLTLDEVQVFMVSSEQEINDAFLQQVIQRGHSRVPVYEGTNRHAINGLILVKELVLVDEDAGVKVKDLRIRELPFLRADVPLYDALKIFRLGRAHMACLTKARAGRAAREGGARAVTPRTDKEAVAGASSGTTVRTSTLVSLQHLPSNLRQFFTRSLAQATTPGSRRGGEGGAAGPFGRPASSVSMAAAAGALVAGASADYSTAEAVVLGMGATLAAGPGSTTGLASLAGAGAASRLSSPRPASRRGTPSPGLSPIRPSEARPPPLAVQAGPLAASATVPLLAAAEGGHSDGSAGPSPRKR